MFKSVKSVIHSKFVIRFRSTYQPPDEPPPFLPPADRSGLYTSPNTEMLGGNLPDPVAYTAPVRTAAYTSGSERPFRRHCTGHHRHSTSVFRRRVPSRSAGRRSLAVSSGRNFFPGKFQKQGTPDRYDGSPQGGNDLPVKKVARCEQNRIDHYTGHEQTGDLQG